MTRRIPVWVVAVVALAAVVWLLAGPSIDLGSDPASSGQGDIVAGTQARFSDLDLVAVNELPAEARTTLELIASGGPFPFSRDDAVFQNRERLLPRHDDGHYREYTVITPGKSDRGARRIVAGIDGELYYTDDHYSSFREIIGGGS